LRASTAFFDRWLIEGIDAHEFPHENRLQHVLHKERTQGPLVQRVHSYPAHGAAPSGQAFGGRARFGRDQIAETTAGEVVETETIGVLGRHHGPLSFRRAIDQREQRAAGAVQEQLQLAAGDRAKTATGVVPSLPRLSACWLPGAEGLSRSA
jgi:hypothetical protein